MKAIDEKILPEPAPADKRRIVTHETAFGQPRDFLTNRFVYVVISPRARGLSIGVNVNPDKSCNFDCLYCEVKRGDRREKELDVDTMSLELRKTLAYVREGRLREHSHYRTLCGDLLKLRQVSMSGDGEPTLAPDFADAVEAVIRVRALGGFPFFKLVLITNAAGFDQPQVQKGLEHFTKSDEIWAKLDGGTQDFLDKVNRPKMPLVKTLANILALARQRPVIIQSLFAVINGEEPPFEEIKEYAQRLKELKNNGAQISLVQIYSATRPMSHTECGHLPLKILSEIAQTVRRVSGLKAEVF